MKLTTKADHATARDCMAHRCRKHERFEQLLNTNVEDGAECSLCVAEQVRDSFLYEILTPIVVAFTEAEGQLRLLGVDRNPRTGPVFSLLEALVKKAEDGDFEVVAQKVINQALTVEGPKEPQ